MRCVAWMLETLYNPKNDSVWMKVMQRLNDACAEWKEAENMDFCLSVRRWNPHLPISLQSVCRSVLVS